MTDHAQKTQAEQKQYQRAEAGKGISKNTSNYSYNIRKTLEEYHQKCLYNSTFAPHPDKFSNR